jgi:hypothetical protein
MNPAKWEAEFEAGVLKRQRELMGLRNAALYVDFEGALPVMPSDAVLPVEAVRIVVVAKSNVEIRVEQEKGLGGRLADLGHDQQFAAEVADLLSKT